MSSKLNITSASKPVVLAQTIINKTAEKLKVPTKQVRRILNEVDRLQMMANSDYYRAEWRGCDSRSVPTKQAQSVANKEERLHMMATSDYYCAERSGGVRSDEIQDWLEEAGEAIDNTTP